MAAAFALTTLLLTEPTLPLPESTWDIAALGAILIVEATGTVNAATAMTTIETGTGTETVTVIALPVVTTGTVVTGTRRAGVTEGAPVPIRLIARREEATLAAQLRGAHDVLVNVTTTAINPKVLVVFCNRPRLGIQVVVVIKLSSFETHLPYCIKTSNSSCSVN